MTKRGINNFSLLASLLFVLVPALPIVSESVVAAEVSRTGTWQVGNLESQHRIESTGYPLGGYSISDRNFAFTNVYNIQSNKVFDNGIWWITKGNAPALRTAMSVYLDDVYQGDTRLLQFGHKNGSLNSWPEVAAIYNTGYVRLVPYGLKYGTSFILGPSYWEEFSPVDRYFHDLQITRVDISTGGGTGSLALTISAHDFEDTYWPSYHLNITYRITLPEPTATKVEMQVEQNYTVANSFSISAERQLNHEGFRLVQFSSMYMDNYYHDSDALEYPSQNGSTLTADFGTIPFGKSIFSSQPWPQALSGTAPWIQLRHSDNVGWQGNTPNTLVILNTPNIGQHVVPQGYINCSDNENNDDVGAWLNYESAPIQFTSGYTHTVIYTLIAQDDPTDKLPKQSMVPSNSSPACNNITVNVGNTTQRKYGLSSVASTRQTFAGTNNGPVHLVSTSNSPLIASQRVIYGGWSYSEMMGLPIEQLSREYLFPYYNNVAMDSQLRVSNVGGADTTIKVYLGADPNPIDSYTLAAGGATRKNYAYNSGPLRVASSDSNILTTIRVLYANSSLSEMMGMPVEQLSKDYLFPWYNNSAMDSQLRVSNVGGADTTIKVYLGSSTTPIDQYTLAAGGATRKNYTGKNSGPLRVTSSASNILATIRVLYAGRSLSELMGFPIGQLGQEYWYPVYDNSVLDSQLRVSNVGSATTHITVYAGGVPIDNYDLGKGGAVRKNYPKNTGPLHVVSSTQPILTTVRLLYGSSLYEMTGLPESQLSTQYFFPWYNNSAMNSELRFAVP
jgi:hypothetical protein